MAGGERRLERPLRVLIAHNAYQLRGGEDAVVENEAALLRANGHDVALHMVSNDAIISFLDKARTVLEVGYSRAAAAGLTAAIGTHRPDVLHVHNVFPLLTPSIYDAARSAGVPIVQTVHNYRMACASGFLFRDGHVCQACLGRAPLPAIRHRCYRGSLAGSAAVAGMIAWHRARGTWSTRIDRYIALTGFARGKLEEMGVPADLIAVKPNFVADRGAPPSGEAEAARAGALFVGRLAAEKGVLDLVAAWPGEGAPGERAVLRVAGSGPQAAAVGAAAGPGVHLLGQRTMADLDTDYRRAAILVMPSIGFESMPMTLLEAWAAGLPVAAFRHSAFADIVEDGVTGLLAAPGDIAGLVARVTQALAQPDRLREMGRAGRRLFERRYTPQANYPQLMAVYAAARAQARAAGTVA